VSKEQAIIEAAEHEFMENGFEAAKTTKIAARAGVTHAMLHYYYRTKENLFNIIFEKKTELLKASLFTSFDNPDTPFLDKVRNSIEAHFDFLRANPNLPRFVINELISKPNCLKLFEKQIKRVAKMVMSRVKEEIEVEIAKGTINPIDPVTLMVDIASMNIFVFAALPLIRSFALESYVDEDAFLEERKKENVDIIIRRLTK
jgi:AcrR family transcriptional regulator